MFHYVYKITDRLTERYYIGARSSSVEPEQDLGIMYFGSSASPEFSKRIKRFPSQFSYQILETFETRDEAFAYEQELLKEELPNPNSYNGGLNIVPSLPQVSYSSRQIINYLGSLIEIARKERKMSESTLAERVGVTRSTIHRIQNGNGSVAIQTYIEAAIVLGIPLLGGDKENITNMASLLSYMNTLLPERIRGVTVVDDDF